MKTAIKYSCLIFFAVLLYSCYDKDILNIENKIVFTPEYAVPVGSDSFIMEDIVTAASFDTIPADSSHWHDSIIFQYNDRYYYLPPDAWFDTVLVKEFNFAQIQEWLDRATYLMFRLNLQNAIPGNVVSQIEFLNINNDPLFSLFNDPGLHVPPGDVETPAILQEDVYLSEEEMDMLKSVVRIRIYFRIYIDDISSGVSYYPDQNFILQLGLRVGLELNANDALD